MKKIIYAVIIIISLAGLILYSRLNCYQQFIYYEDEKDKDSSRGNFIIGDFTYLFYYYLKDDRSLADYGSAYKSLIGYLQTSISIDTDEKFPYKISLVDCHVVIRDEKNNVIPYKNIQIMKTSIADDLIIFQVKMNLLIVNHV
jgi:hypothetical protein